MKKILKRFLRLIELPPQEKTKKLKETETRSYLMKKLESSFKEKGKKKK